MEIRKTSEPYDIVLVGAGVTGLYALYILRNAGYNIIALEAGSEVGGTWYWNRYPGLRVDIESIEYSYSFSEELQQEWSWPHRYSYQAELLRYLKHVADRFDLRRSIRLDTRVVATQFDEKADRWTLTAESGEQFTARYCVVAAGVLSAPNLPDFPGLESFKGKQYHTGQWPEDGVDFRGERVAVIGTGSTGVQIIPAVAREARHLTVFQRTARYVVPSRNCPMPTEYEERVKANYKDWRQRAQDSPTGFISVNYQPTEWVTELSSEVSPEERTALYEDRWKSGGLALYNVYPDVYSDLEANETLAEFLRAKIRQQIKDPELQEKLVPRYPVLTNRLCTDDGYYEVFARDSVELVDLAGSELEITPKGIRAQDLEHELDSIVFATGYEGFIGSMKRMGIVGKDGRKLNDHWADEVPTSLGLMVNGFPNLFMLSGPGAPTLLRMPQLMAIDQTKWVDQAISYMWEHGKTRLEPTEEFEAEWLQRCKDNLALTLAPMTKSWHLGANIAGKIRHGLVDYGSVKDYQAICDRVVASSFAGFVTGGPT